MAARDGRSLVLVGAESTSLQLGWMDFLDAMGGAVPSWRALGEQYAGDLKTASVNENPTGYVGEAWRLFEDLVADGLEFCFGRKVRRLGARKRGQRVSDMITQLPDGAVLVVDAKATKSGFNAAISELRALVEYTELQRLRQRGHNEVFSSLIVSSSFQQAADGLVVASREFQAQASVPASFLTADLLGRIVRDLSRSPQIRNAINWRRLFAGSLVTEAEWQKQLDQAITERY